MKISKMAKRITLMAGLILMLPAVSAAQQAAAKGAVRDAQSGDVSSNTIGTLDPAM